MEGKAITAPTVWLNSFFGKGLTYLELKPTLIIEKQITYVITQILSSMKDKSSTLGNIKALSKKAFKHKETDHMFDKRHRALKTAIAGGCRLGYFQVDRLSKENIVISDIITLKSIMSDFGKPFSSYTFLLQTITTEIKEYKMRHKVIHNSKMFLDVPYEKQIQDAIASTGSKGCLLPVRHKIIFISASYLMTKNKRA